MFFAILRFMRIEHLRYIKLRNRELNAAKERTIIMKGEEEKSLNNNGSPWGPGSYYDSNLVSFSNRFSDVLPSGNDLREYIETTFASQKGKLIGLELGGPGVELFRGFSPGFFLRTAGVCLTDSRDNVGDHTLIKEDLLARKAKKKVEKWQDGKKIDVIFESMIAGHYALPRDPFFMAEETRYWYRQLAEGGLIFAESPWAFGNRQDDINYVPDWARLIKNNYPGRLEVKENDGYVILRKLPGAPEELPLLSAKQILASEEVRVIARHRQEREWL